LDEFGLIVCGWSAQWDPALCSALDRCRTHRFTTYWTYRGELDSEANRLISLRRAQAIQISDADSFFEKLAGRLEALDEYDRPHPLSTRMAVETLKNYLVEPRHRIRLSDLITQEAEAAYEKLFSPDRYPRAGIPYDGPHLLERMRKYESDSERLQALMITGAAWGEPQHINLWRKSLQRIATPPPLSSGTRYNDDWESARGYTALRLLYASGLAAISAERFDNLRGLFETPIPSEGNGQVPILVAINTWNVVRRETLNAGLGQRFGAPMTQYLSGNLREALREYLPSENVYDRTFDFFEYLLALFYSDVTPDNSRWCLTGGFAWSLERSDNVVSRVSQDVERLGELWPPLRAGFFDGSVERFKTAEQSVIDHIRQHPSWFW
jgi:hypothetical protein